MKILIAEDEYYSRQRLIKILQDEDFEVVSAVEDGQSAKEYLEENSDVDVVITDIIMPRLNGLELSAFISEKMSWISVIILSGYEEFEYARKAIESGVKYYLVKPVKKEELIGILKQLQLSFDNKTRMTETQKEGYNQSFSSGYLPTRAILNSQNLLQIFFPGLIEHQHENCCMALIQTDRSLEEKDIIAVRKICMQKFKDHYLGDFFSMEGDEFAVIILIDNIDNKNSFDNSKRKAAIIFEDILNYLRVRLQADITIGISFFGADNELNDAYKECMYAMSERLMKGWNLVLQYSEAGNKRKCFNQEEERELTDALQAFDYDKASKMVDTILLRKDLLQTGDINVYYDVVLDILLIINNVYHSFYQRRGGTARIEIMFSKGYDLYHFKKREDLLDYLKNIMRQICDWGKDAPKGNGKDIINDMIQYVQHHYQNNLSLQELAEKRYFMNPSYLSRLFKNETGTKFSKYLINLRIEKSQNLLKDNKLKINEIAASVGYNNTSHFIQLFKKYVGCTPEEYRSRKTFDSGNYSEESRQE